MKAGELFVEQVFIGALVLAMLALPWLPEVACAVAESEGLRSVVTGSLALGVAFLIGVPCDRFADTLTDRLDRHSRLRAALTRAEGKPLVAADDEDLLVDYFPEDKLRIMALRDAAPIVAWIDYHRSRACGSKTAT